MLARHKANHIQVVDDASTEQAFSLKISHFRGAYCQIHCRSQTVATAPCEAELCQAFFVHALLSYQTI
jgi:hypothetical protein